MVRWNRKEFLDKYLPCPVEVESGNRREVASHQSQDLALSGGEEALERGEVTLED
jgi:hypothetical protein